LTQQDSLDRDMQGKLLKRKLVDKS